jgi:hypothetical protein
MSVDERKALLAAQLHRAAARFEQAVERLRAEVVKQDA